MGGAIVRYTTVIEPEPVDSAFNTTDVPAALSAASPALGAAPRLVSAVFSPAAPNPVVVTRQRATAVNESAMVVLDAEMVSITVRGCARMSPSLIFLAALASVLGSPELMIC